MSTYDITLRSTPTAYDIALSDPAAAADLLPNRRRLFAQLLAHVITALLRVTL